jgi:hypothetical protein
MKTVAIESLRRHLGQLLRSEEPVLVTRYGKLVGVFSPVHDAKAVAAAASRQAAARRPKKRKADPQLALLRDD